MTTMYKSDDAFDRLLTYKPTGKQMECLITMLDGSEQVFFIDDISFGQHLLEAVLEFLNINERQYFGITYVDENKDKYWLENTMKISKQISNKKMKFEFQVKFYPPEIGLIKDNLTRYYLVLQVRQDICSGRLPCSYYVSVILSSYIIQGQMGDYRSQIHDDIDYIRDHPITPSHLQTPDFMEDVMKLHKLQCGLTQEDADKKMLINASKLSFYGVDFHYMRNSDAEDVAMGVNHSGIAIYQGFCRLFKLSWCRLISVKYSKKKVIIEIRGMTEFDPNKKLKFKCETMKLAIRAYKAIVDHHYFFRLSDFKKDLQQYRDRQIQEITYQKKKQLEENSKSSKTNSKNFSTINSEMMNNDRLNRNCIEEINLIQNFNRLRDEPKSNNTPFNEHKASKILQSLQKLRNLND